jgi:phosphopantothenoylcysteine decarboxylase/phosphopantothenate--cysteine ligase
MAQRRILLIIGGGIAAYKALELIRLCRRAEIAVTPILTRAAKEFVTPLAVASLAGEAVHEDLFSLTNEVEIGHIALSRLADLVVVAPATANLIARMANGVADDLATVALLATDKRILLAPAMNVRMWHHPATARNLERLRADGALFVGPAAGSMACGEFGGGRLAEPDEILAAIRAALAGDTRLPDPPDPAFLAARAADGRATPRPLAGRHVLVTSGPTHEPIDPVRYIANRSSGRQGHAIAAAAAAAGARVTLISGPVQIADPAGVETRHVMTAREMAAAVDAALPADVAIFCAAVADWRVDSPSGGKIKKGAAGAPSLALVENPDILAGVARRGAGRPSLVVGFAAETDDVLASAIAKRARKGCDILVANDVGGGKVMGGDENTVVIVDEAGATPWPTLTKRETAERLVALVARRLGAPPA